jgi:tRNA modification GTPase
MDLVDSGTQRVPPHGDVHEISALTGAGLDELVAALTGFVQGALTSEEDILVTRERHRAVLQETLEALDRAQGAGGEDIIAEELRLAAKALGRLTGRVDVEDILDVIFRDFCIGK